MKNLMSNKIIKILFYIVDFVAIWALIDWITSLFTKKPFVFSPMDNLVYPAVAGVIFALIDPLGKAKKK